MICAVYLPVLPSVRDRLPVPGGVDDCLPFFYANIPQSRYDSRIVYGLKIEGDNSGLAIRSDTRPRSLSFSLPSGHWFWGVGHFS